MKKPNPPGTRYQAWSLFTEKQRGIRKPVIRRWAIWPTGERICERLPIAQYSHFRDKPEDLAKFVIRLNAELKKEESVREAVEIRHAYIDDALMERYRRRRSLEVPSQDRVSTEIFYLRKHFLNFFTVKQNLQKNPKEWHRIHKDEWADYLLSDPGVPKAPATKREIIQAANRFIKFLNEERPTEVEALVFKPISAKRFQDLTARREIDPSVKKRRFIPTEDWKKILKSCPPEIKPFVLLSYYYGARRGEVLGFLPGDVLKEMLRIDRQLEYLTPSPSYKPNKSKLKRTVPHWSIKVDRTYSWVESIQKCRIDPDHLTELWKDLMRALHFTYDFHDLRHTFVTRALRKHNHRDVQLAAGHKHLKTTMGYAHDDRFQSTEVYKPRMVA